MDVKNSIVLSASKYVNSLFDRKSTIAALYHNFDHTLEVVENVKEISTAMGVDHAKKEIVLLAAWFHDTGYLYSPVDHEERSVAIAAEFLRSEHYSELKIKKVAGCIRATKVPQKPKTLLEKIMSDADLLNLGNKDSIERGEMLRAENESLSGHAISEADWIRQSISFFQGHRYHTSYAIENYTASRDRNLKMLKKRLQMLEAKKLRKTAPKKKTAKR